MELIPAIDLLDGKVVRLHQGRYDQVTVYDDDPGAVAAVAGASPALAQTQLEEVIVTAQRREQTLQEVPMSVSAFTGAERAHRGWFEQAHGGHAEGEVGRQRDGVVDAGLDLGRRQPAARSACFSGEGAWFKAQFAIHRNMVKPSCLSGANPLVWRQAVATRTR